MKLYIDSSNNLKTTVRLDDIELVKEYSKPQEQDILGAVDQLLKQEKCDWHQISSIEVNPGPGSFTGVRLGVAIANALAFALKLKVNQQEPPIQPQYGAEPNITKAES